MILENFNQLEVLESMIDSEIEDFSINSLLMAKTENSVESLPELSEITTESRENVESLTRRTETIEMLTDHEMTENIASYLKGVENLRLENWTQLSIEKRTELLNQIEQRIAAYEHRPPLKVEIKDMPPRRMGYQDSYNHKIVLNSKIVGSNNPNMHREVIDTIIHEGRHAYQHYNVDVRCIHESPSEVAQWRENFYSEKFGYYTHQGKQILIEYGHGRKMDVDYRLYYHQPVEIDARNFASDVMLKLKQEGFIS